MFDTHTNLDVVYVEKDIFLTQICKGLKPKTIHYGYHQSLIYGLKMSLILCIYEGSLFALGFCDDKKNKQEALEDLQKQFHFLDFQYDDNSINAFVKKHTINQKPKTVKMMLVGTKYQHSVWKGLIHTIAGETMTYSELTQRLGKGPQYTHSVSTVGVAKNPISLLVPCHRIVSKNGGINNYRWGIDIKSALIQKEIQLYCKQQKMS